MELIRVRKAQGTGMKGPVSLVAFLTACFFLTFFVSAALAAEIRPGHLLVGFSEEASPATVDQTLARADVDSVRNLGQIDTRLVRLEDGVTRAEAANALRRSAAVEYVEPDYRLEAAVTPSDSLFNLMWGLHNTGQKIRGFSGQADADIDAPEAWDTETGLGGDVVVGIADTGIDLQHGDLAPNLWSNPGEIPGNGIDDDRNGKIDDVHGWNWVSNNANPDDDEYHGTHVAGTVAARGNNAKGVVGVSWGAKLAALKGLNSEGVGFTSNLAAAALYAGQEGMDVYNGSFGGGGYSTTFLNALSASAGTLFVFAAGNSGQDIDSKKYYPCSYDLPNVICVGSTTYRDALSYFSNYGTREVDLAAPGSDIASTYPQDSSGVDQYWYLSGTSMAAPHVAGAAALLRQARRTSSVTDLRNWIVGHGDPLPSLSGKTVSGRRLNVNRSLLEARGKPPAPLITSGPIGPTNSASASFTFKGETGASMQCRLDNGAWEACTSPKTYASLSEGPHTFKVRQIEAAGIPSEEATRDWIVDTVAPAAPSITSGPSGPTDTTAASFVFTGEERATFECRLDDGPWQGCLPPKAYSRLPQGTYSFGVRQTDLAGNTSDEAIRSWTVNVAIPAARVSVRPGFNSTVNAISEPDEQGTRYVGGEFTAVNAWETGGGAVTDISSGEVAPEFPKVNGSAQEVIPDGAGGFFIAGTFECIGPNSNGNCDGAVDYRRSNFAHIRFDGSVSAWNPDVRGGGVNTMVRSGDTLYLGGGFTSVGGEGRNRAAAIDVVTGNLLPWNPNVDGRVEDIEVSRGAVYLAGEFSTIGAQTRRRAGAVDSDSGQILPWDPHITHLNTSAAVFDLEIVNDDVYLAGEFSCLGRYGGEFCEPPAVSRSNVARVGTDGTVSSWRPHPDGVVLAIEASQDSVFLGGTFTEVGGEPRSYLAAIDQEGNLKEWNPDVGKRTTWYILGAVRALEIAGSALYFGGFFDTVGGVIRNKAAAVRVDDGGLLPWNPNIGESNQLDSASSSEISVYGNTVYVGGGFELAGGRPRNGAAAIASDRTLTPWNPRVGGSVYAVEVEGEKVFLGGAFDRVSGESRGMAAAISVDGHILPWNPELTAKRSSIGGGVGDIEVEGQTIYLGGRFDGAGGQPRVSAAAVDASSGGLLPWDPGLQEIRPYVDPYVTLEVREDMVVLGGDFKTVGTATRTGLAAVDPGTGALLPWAPDISQSDSVNPGSIRAMEVFGGVVYFGGYFGSVEGTARGGEAAIDLKTGELLPWDPETGGGTFFNLAKSGDVLYLAGDFGRVGGQPRRGVAAVGSSTGAVLPWNPGLGNPGLGSYLNRAEAIEVAGDTVVIGGSFTGIGGEPRNHSAAVGVDGTVLGAWPSPSSTTRLLSVSKTGAGLGTVRSSPAGISCGTICRGYFDTDSTITLSASPAQNSTFTGWSGAGCTAGGPCVVKMDEAHSVTASFAEIRHELSVSKSGTGSGTVSSTPSGIDCGPDCSDSYTQGTRVTLAASPEADSTFVGWSGANCSGTNPCTVAMSRAQFVTAQFSRIKHGLSVLKSGTGSGTVTSSPSGIDCGPDCSESYDHGQTVVLTARPSAKSSFGGWSGADCSGTGTCEVTVRESNVVEAEFTAGDSAPSKPAFGELRVDGPAKVKLGAKSTYVLRVRNRGDSGALDVRISVQGKRINEARRIGTIGPGGSRAVRLGIVFRNVGRTQLNFEVTSENADAKAVRKTVRVIR